jgi:hypothetical protein
MKHRKVQICISITSAGEVCGIAVDAFPCCLSRSYSIVKRPGFLPHNMNTRNTERRINDGFHRRSLGTERQDERRHDEDGREVTVSSARRYAAASQSCWALDRTAPARRCRCPYSESTLGGRKYLRSSDITARRAPMACTFSWPLYDYFILGITEKRKYTLLYITDRQRPQEA